MTVCCYNYSVRRIFWILHGSFQALTRWVWGRGKKILHIGQLYDNRYRRWVSLSHVTNGGSAIWTTLAQRKSSIGSSFPTKININAYFLCAKSEVVRPSFRKVYNSENLNRRRNRLRRRRSRGFAAPFSAAKKRIDTIGILILPLRLRNAFR